MGAFNQALHKASAWSWEQLPSQHRQGRGVGLGGLGRHLHRGQGLGGLVSQGHHVRPCVAQSWEGGSVSRR